MKALIAFGLAAIVVACTEQSTPQTAQKDPRAALVAAVPQGELGDVVDGAAEAGASHGWTLVRGDADRRGLLGDFAVVTWRGQTAEAAFGEEGRLSGGLPFDRWGTQSNPNDASLPLLMQFGGADGPIFLIYERDDERMLVPVYEKERWISLRPA